VAEVDATETACAAWLAISAVIVRRRLRTFIGVLLNCLLL
jgi:hypothetical protein